MYFVGNIFNKDDEVSKYDDRGFAFSEQEKQDLELVGLPIQLEHDSNLCVGTILRSWYEDGQRWILGNIDKEGVEGYFASNAVKTKKYTGLSLQHISCEMSDGTQRKIPVEVSLCEEPRRPDCRVRQHTASAKTPYIRLCEQLAKMAEQTTTTHIASAETAENVQTEPVETPQTLVPNQDELLQLLVKMEEEKNAAEFKLNEYQTKVSAFEEAEQAAKEATLKAQREKLSGLSTDLLKWCNTNGFELTDDRIEKMNNLMSNNPASAEILFEIAHCASNKHVEAQKALAEQKQVTKTQTLQARVESIIKQRQNAAGPVCTTSHKASAVTVKTANPYAVEAPTLEPRFVRNGTPPESLIQAIKRQRTAYSGRDAAQKLYSDLS